MENFVPSAIDHRTFPLTGRPTLFILWLFVPGWSQEVARLVTWWRLSMPKKQRRRSISVRGDVYDRVKKYCDDKRISMSAFVEDRILEHLGVPPGQPTAKGAKSEIGQHFTF